MVAQTFQNSGCGKISSTLLGKNRYIEIVELSNKKKFIHFDIRVIAVLISLLVSFFTLLNPGLPNDDAYTYIRTAEIALNDGVDAAIDYYSWAGYSLLIAFVSKAGTDLLTAAQLINAFFYLFLFFLLLVL